jgi:hypothetical protein
MRWAGHVARMELTKRDQTEDTDVDKKIIEWILEKYCRKVCNGCIYVRRKTNVGLT